MNNFKDTDIVASDIYKINEKELGYGIVSEYSAVKLFIEGKYLRFATETELTDYNSGNRDENNINYQSLELDKFKEAERIRSKIYKLKNMLINLESFLDKKEGGLINIESSFGFNISEYSIEHLNNVKYIIRMEVKDIRNMITPVFEKNVIECKTKINELEDKFKNISCE